MDNGAALVDRVLLDATAVEMQDDFSLWDAAGTFVHWAVTTAFLHPGEFPESLYNLNKVSFYAAQIDNGGHKQFAQNSGWERDVIDRVAAGLEEINATEFAAIYREFRHLMDTDPTLRRSVLEEQFVAPPDSIGRLDNRFYELGGAERIVEHGAIWLRSLTNLVLLSPEALNKEQAAVMARNTALEARRAAQTAAN